MKKGTLKVARHNLRMTLKTYNFTRYLSIPTTNTLEILAKAVTKSGSVLGTQRAAFNVLNTQHTNAKESNAIDRCAVRPVVGVYAELDAPALDIETCQVPKSCYPAVCLRIVRVLHVAVQYAKIAHVAERTMEILVLSLEVSQGVGALLLSSKCLGGCVK